MEATDKGVITMKASLITCSVLAATLGFSGLASAQDWNGRRDHERDQRFEQRQGQRFEHRQDQRQEARQEQRREDRAQQWNQQRQYSYRQQPSYIYSQPSYGYSQPNYAYSAPTYYGNHARFQRGGYLPYEYRNQSYYVNDWNAYPGLYSPPYGYQWVQVGSDFALVALATGLIANLLTN
jgi:Ni/Co efflux regulator RcnB